MKTQSTPPNVSNFVKSLRDIGYTLEVAVADILDNSISANANHIQIYAMHNPEMVLCILDDGSGMAENELVEAMRLSSKSPEDVRNAKDLGKFGLGLKTASFSQCKKLTTLSKQNNVISIKQWDLDYIANENEWLLITPDLSDFKDIPLFDEFNNIETGTLVVWQNIDNYKEDFSESIKKVMLHLSLVFHRFLEDNFNSLKVTVNGNKLEPFNPFNSEHNATQGGANIEKIKINGTDIEVVPYVLPHHSKVSQQEWDKYSTEDGYIKSQGFYLYRAKRLLIYGTWWGMHKASDAHKLVRIKIDIPNNQDEYWGIDIKKSHAKPRADIKDNLKNVLNKYLIKGSRVQQGKGKKIQDKTTTRFWQTVPVDSNFRFALNKEHPLYQRIKESSVDFSILEIYFKGIEAYLPLEAIQAQLQQNPHEIKQAQETALSENDIQNLVTQLKVSGLDDEYITSLLKTEIFKNNKELLE
ncbi:MAG: ATP-binding protein [Urechidicola sp.]|nr:ATP-binding protein [Urechidicola sp.]